MRQKLNDALYEESRCQKQFEYWRTQYYLFVNRNGLVDNLYQQRMSLFLNSLWTEGKEKNKKKVDHLVKKWKTPENKVTSKEAPNIRNIKYTDTDLANITVNDKNDEVVSYGGVDVTENMESVLKMNPKMMM